MVLLFCPHDGDGFELGEPYIVFFFDRNLKTSPDFVGEGLGQPEVEHLHLTFGIDFDGWRASGHGE